MANGKKLKVVLITAGKDEQRYECAGLRFQVPDGVSGGGGWVGIRPGHVRTLAALKGGEILLFGEGGELTERLPGGRGFAMVENDTVSFVLE